MQKHYSKRVLRAVFALAPALLVMCWAEFDPRLRTDAIPVAKKDALRKFFVMSQAARSLADSSAGAVVGSFHGF